MTAIKCPVHDFTHLSAKSATVTGVSNDYNYACIKFTIEEKVKYGYLKSYLNTDVASSQFAIEMDVECPDGYNSTNHASFTCKDNRGVIVANNISMCILSNVHTKLQLLSDKLFDFETICCVAPLAKLTLWPNLLIGEKCMFRCNQFKRNIGVCKWIGKINNEVECIGVEATNWISNEANGFCKEIKIFDCREGHGILIRAVDIEMDTEELDLNENGLVLLRNIFNSQPSTTRTKESLQIGRRAELLFTENKSYGICGDVLLYGVVRWIGTINKGECVGIELDYTCDGGMNGVISYSESFQCEPGHGAVCPRRSITFDSFIYSVEFTVGDVINIHADLNEKENWGQKIVEERDLKVNSNVFIFIEKCDRILNIKGVLKWLGYIQGVSISILEMDENFPTFTQPKINHILENAKPVAHIMVHSKYLFKYRSLKCYEKRDDDILNVDLGYTTEFGILKWKGIDVNDQLYYGFQMEKSSELATDGTFSGQRLFQCFEGFGVLISAKEVRDSALFKIRRFETLNQSISRNWKVTREDLAPIAGKSSIKYHHRPQNRMDYRYKYIRYGDKERNQNSIIPYANHKDFMQLLITIANKGGISPDDLLSTTMDMENKSILAPLVDNMTTLVNIYKYPDVISHLLRSRSFGSLELAVDDCPVDAVNNRQLLIVAAESLREGNVTLFEKCMKKCTDKNILMDNGETFLTYLVKENMPQTTIVKTIKAYEFDMSKANDENMIPLKLACGKMMTDVVDCIVKYINTQEARKKLCVICAVHEITVVFNCGHNSCKECSENISQCHVCKEEISTRGSLFLN